ncbi:hypothetical protein [uncultured Oscillibacter sp.]|uniref:hypothetical protein n=1 Tax=uncultured Oscillibacter sp. TaxID=876091 RepID=UPI0025F48158|nr:hypothetical protein [uncultured Oscillibacter sp.]
MGQCTWSDGKGNWGIKGVDLAELPPNAYGGLYKLHNIERLVTEFQQEQDAARASDVLWELQIALGLGGRGVLHGED